MSSEKMNTVNRNGNSISKSDLFEKLNCHANKLLDEVKSKMNDFQSSFDMTLLNIKNDNYRKNCYSMEEYLSIIQNLNKDFNDLEKKSNDLVAEICQLRAKSVNIDSMSVSESNKRKRKLVSDNSATTVSPTIIEIDKFPEIKVETSKDQSEEQVVEEVERNLARKKSITKNINTVWEYKNGDNGSTSSKKPELKSTYDSRSTNAVTPQASQKIFCGLPSSKIVTPTSPTILDRPSYMKANPMPFSGINGPILPIRCTLKLPPVSRSTNAATLDGLPSSKIVTPTSPTILDRPSYMKANSMPFSGINRPILPIRCTLKLSSDSRITNAASLDGLSNSK